MASEQLDEQAFERFFARVQESLVRMAFVYTGDSEAARDLAQETLIRAWRDWHRLSRHQNPEAWARRVLHNLAVSRRRRINLERRHAETSKRVSGAPPDVGHLDLVRAISNLPADQRRALVLHDVAGLSVSEVSEEMGRPEGTVKSWLSRARASLTRSIESISPIEVPGGRDHERE